MVGALLIAHPVSSARRAGQDYVTVAKLRRARLVGLSDPRALCELEASYAERLALVEAAVHRSGEPNRWAAVDAAARAGDVKATRVLAKRVVDKIKEDKA